MKISKSGITDPSDPDGKWAAVKVKPVKKLKRPVTLKEIKADPALAEMELIKQSRLSVSVVTPEEWDYIVALSNRKAG
jgi:predicted RNA-binding protein with PUA-like domain